MSNDSPRLDPKSMPLQGDVTWKEDKHFIGTAPSGKTVDIDANKVAGATPMELVLLGLGGCASYDVVGILQKSRQDIEDVRCELSAVRADTVPAVYTDIHLHFVVTGKDVKEKQVEKAVALSADKYCSASKMLADGGVHVTHSFEVVAS